MVTRYTCYSSDSPFWSARSLDHDIFHYTLFSMAAIKFEMAVRIYFIKPGWLGSGMAFYRGNSQY